MTRPGFGSRIVQVPCTVDIALMVEQLHAHVELDGIDIQPGDAVLVHEAPTTIDFGQQQVFDRRATIIRASWFARAWTRLCGLFDLSALYEVGFSSDRLNYPANRRTP